MSEAAPAPEGAIVAVLQKRGRFLTAEPLFPAQADERGTHRRSGRMVVDPRTGAGRLGPERRAGVGDLVLVQAAAGGRSRDGRRGGPARVLRVLGRPEVAHDVIEGLMLDRGLRRGFDPAVGHEAREARDRGRQAGVPPGVARRDLTQLPTFTIDPAGARDFDDAISAERLGDGAIRVWVHIADVAAHVPEGSLVDREARRRGTSVYVPGAVEPMLPEALSNDACSLVPGQDRLAVTVELELDGAVTRRAAFYRSLIRSDQRLTYEQVDEIFAGGEAPPSWGPSLRAARQAAGALARERTRRGALVVDSPEPEFAFDREGHVREIVGRVQTESHRLIEHLMIAANEAVARRLDEGAIPTLYRVHERPEPERVKRLVEQLASLGVATPAVPEPLSPSQAAAVVSECSRRVAEHVRRTGHGSVGLSALVLRSLKQAQYSPRNLGHAGLSSPYYCHFTSPIRRYPDLVCHRALLSAVGAGETAPAAGGLAELAAWTSERERAAMSIERDADDVARCFALEQLLYRAGWDLEFTGEVTGLIGPGAFVVFGAPASSGSDALASASYEGMVPVRRLAGAGPGEREWWELNEQGTILSGSRSARAVRIGDALVVRVRRVEPVRGRADLELVGEDERAEGARGRRRG